MAVCVGCGLNVDVNGVLQVDLDGDPGSGIHCDNTNGLSLQIQHTNGNCVDLTGNGTSGSPLHAEINLADTTPGLICTGTGLSIDLSEDACNGLRLLGNGLHAWCPDSISQIMNVSPAFVPFGINSAGAGTFAIPSGCNNSCNGGNWHICNTLCCTVAGFISCRIYGGAVSGASVGFDAYAYVELSLNGSPFGGVSPPVFLRMQNLAGSQNYWDISNEEERNFLVLGPGECVDMQMQQVIHVVAGTATWSTGPNFEYYVHLTQTGCC